MYDKHISKIKSLQFGLLSPEEIRNESVTEITKHQSFRADGTPIPGGLFDSRTVSYTHLTLPTKLLV